MSGDLERTDTTTHDATKKTVPSSDLPTPHTPHHHHRAIMTTTTTTTTTTDRSTSATGHHGCTRADITAWIPRYLREVERYAEESSTPVDGVSWNTYVGKWQAHAWTEDTGADDDDGNGARTRLGRRRTRTRRRLMHVGFYPRVADAVRAHARIASDRRARRSGAATAAHHSHDHDDHDHDHS